ncbi:hypothetical protein [Streptomyces sp. NPDC051569]|uniref:hypothetical protein n=1 Tax=Streptomyces sp. NPDC051569 TaxID=3365661 RepID=UPI0037B38B0C
MPSHYDELPDLAFGHHPVHGIVAANPKNLAASRWMLEGLDFHPVPDQPALYVLADQERDGQGRTTRAVALLRASSYRVDVDVAFDPSLAPDAAPLRDQVPIGELHVAFAEHPRLGIVAAVDSRVSGFTGLALLEHGWRHNLSLDIYTLPATTGRHEALAKVTDTTYSLHQCDVRVAVQPHLARHIAACHRPAPVTTVAREQRQDTPRASPINAAALSRSPARTGVPGRLPVHTPVPPAAAALPVDPRTTFSRPH